MTTPLALSVLALQKSAKGDALSQSEHGPKSRSISRGGAEAAPSITLEQPSWLQEIVLKGSFTSQLLKGDVDGSSQSHFTGKRLRSLFHRSWFMENKRFERGERTVHPVFSCDVRSRSSSFSTSSSLDVDVAGWGDVPSKEKAWERMFSGFLESALAESSTHSSKESEDHAVGGEEKGEKNASETASRSAKLQSPKAVRSMGGVSHAFTAVTEHFTTTPIPIPRKSSPHLASLAASKAATSTEIKLRLSFTEIHNNAIYSGDSASAFLGEELSVKRSNPLLSMSANSEGLSTLRKSYSLEELQKAVSSGPCMLRMPPRKTHEEMGDTTETIPIYSWIMPYIVACSPPKFMQSLIDLPSIFGQAASAESTLESSFHGQSSKMSSSTSTPESLPKSNRRSSWWSLGIVWVCKDPSWRAWEERAVFLCDNYLFECMPDFRTGIIGYAHLGGSRISNLVAPVLGVDSSGPTSVREGDVQQDSMPRGGTKGEISSLCLNVLISTRPESARATFWICGQENGDLAILEKALVRAQELTLEDVYEFADGPEEEVLLGRGRFNEVRKARRIYEAPCTWFNAKSPQSSPSRSTSKHSALDRSRSVDSPMTSSHSNYSEGVAPDELSIFGEAEGFEVVAQKASSDFNEEDACALKLVSKEVFWKRVNLGKERTDSLVREVLAQSLACGLDSTPARLPVVQIYGALETIDGFAIELELMQHIDLFDKLSRDGVFSESQAQQVVLQLVDAVALCNRLGIAHRDIKLSNITFPRSKSDPRDEGENIFIKLADFGMAGFVGKDGKLRGRCGTPGYVAPDILRAGINEAYGINVDLFSIGVVAYTLLCGYEPFYGTDDQELIRANKAIEYEFHQPEWAEVSSLAQDWIYHTLAGPETRMTPIEARQHPWLADAVQKEDERKAGSFSASVSHGSHRPCCLM